MLCNVIEKFINLKSFKQTNYLYKFKQIFVNENFNILALPVVIKNALNMKNTFSKKNC